MPTTELSQFGALDPVKITPDAGSRTAGRSAPTKAATPAAALRVVVDSRTTEVQVRFAPKSIEENAKVRELNRALKRGFAHTVDTTSR